MFEFIGSNWSTFVVGAIVATLLFAAALKLMKDKKNHKSACGCNCTDCPSKGMCHTK